MPYSSMGHGIINILKQTLPRTLITHAPYATTKRYIILACVRQLHLSSTVYYRIFAWHTIEQLDPPILLDK
jgi:hypothetical protein